MIRDGAVPGLESEAFTNASTITSWLQKQPQDVKVHLARDIFGKLLDDVAEPRPSSTSACVKLCGFVQLCAKSADGGLRRWAFSEETSARLFGFCVERNDQQQHRAMRLVLDVLVTTFSRNPDPEAGRRIRAAVLDTLVAVVSRQSTRSLIKSSLHSLVHFLSKRAVCLADIESAYRNVKPSASGLPPALLWRSVVADVFSWMNLHYVCPAAGKFHVFIFQGLQELASASPPQPGLSDFGVETWLGWVQDALAANPGVLEPIKNYVFAPLFTVDKASSLELLRSFNRRSSASTTAAGLDDLALLQLAGLEIGRKSGLVDEPGAKYTAQDGGSAIAIQEDVLGDFLVHPSHLVRSSALSLLVSSPFTTRPISRETFNLLQKHLATYHSDYDTKFRYEMLAYSRDLINRVKSVCAVANRTLSRQRPNPSNPTTDADGAAVPGGSGTAGSDEKEAKKKKKPVPEDYSSNEQEAREVLERHGAFLEWYMDFLRGELIPTASYQRHITALKALLPILKLGKRSGGGFHESIDVDATTAVLTDPTWVRLILDLIMDPFDDVRETATAILQLVPRGVLSADVALGAGSADLLASLRAFCARASGLAARTGRADHGNGAARSQGLLCSWLDARDARIALLARTLDGLERKLARAAQNLGHAAVEDSVHMDFAAICYIWQVLAASSEYSDAQQQALREVQRRILRNCEHAWNIVQHVLCDDSPEGHLPEELEEIEGLDTKDLLSYSFRAVHESSNLLRTVVGGLRGCSAGNALYPPLDVFNGAGSLTFTQLSTLRHRGAFATVSSTFITCCQLSPSLPTVFRDMPQSENHLRRWYEGAIECVMNQRSTTRRSAGIPALVIGVLAADAASPSFGEVLTTLAGIAERPARMSETDGSSLPQVHALNCLRDIFRSSLLSKRAEPYLPTALQLATASLKSEVWAVRNCGLLLLRSLIDCLFGTGESKASIESGWDGHTIRISYTKHPSLTGVLMSLLNPEEGSLELDAESGRAEAVFPALDIIRRAGPPEEHRADLYTYVEEYLGSSLWHVREMAARTICSFLLRGDWVGPLASLLSRSRTDANRLHGALLTVKFVFERRAETDKHAAGGDASRLLATLIESVRECGPLQMSSEVRAALLEILNLAARLGRWEYSAAGTLPALLGGEPGKIQVDGVAGSLALLQLQLGMRDVYESARDADVERLQSSLAAALDSDVDTACGMLSIIPEAWQHLDGVHLQLCGVYLRVPLRTQRAEPRALALSNLKQLLDSSLGERRLDQLPSDQDLQALWGELQRGDINPTLSHAILAISGTMMAARVVRRPAAPQSLDSELQAWGAMLADALDADNTFDTRFAAVEAIRSFSAPVGPRAGRPHLPYLLALYDALNDDDDEVRDAAAGAAAPIVGRRVASLEAADLLADWLAERFAHLSAFRSASVSRLAGPQAGLQLSGQASPSAEDLLLKALEFDESLFAVEEQNLFVDEVRESRRWLRVFKATGCGPEDDTYGRLRVWTAAGLAALVGLAQKDDGPLGWTSQQQAFAICAGVLMCAEALCSVAGDGQLTGLLEGFTAVGKRSGVHGSLLRLAETGLSSAEKNGHRGLPSL